MKRISGEIFLGAVLAFSLLLPKNSWAQEIFNESPGPVPVQYIERAEPVEEGEIGMSERDWYENAFQDYEKSPYGYYEEDAFYGDFDLEYWQSDSQADWYDKKFYEYGRGYLTPD